MVVVVVVVVVVQSILFLLYVHIHIWAPALGQYIACNSEIPTTRKVAIIRKYVYSTLHMYVNSSSFT